jgi:hypothetical protein
MANKDTLQTNTTTIDILIVGVSIGYLDAQNHYKIVFPFNDAHLLNLKINKDGKEDFRLDQLATENRRIIFEINPNNRPCVLDDSYITDFIDLTGEHLHNEIRFLPDWRDRGVELDVVGATIFNGGNSEQTVQLVRVGGTRPIHDFGIIGITPRASIELAEGENLTIRIFDGLNEVNSYSTQAGSTYIIEFDNDCKPMVEKLRTDVQPVFEAMVRSSTTDFAMYYRVIEDAINPGIKFGLQSEGEEEDKPCQNCRVTNLKI